MAGIVSRVEGVPVEHSARNALRRLISRHPADNVIEFGDSRSYFAKLDIGAFGVPAAHQDDLGNLSMLAGDPLLSHSPAAHPPNRSGDLQRLHTEWIQSNWLGLVRCRGTYCAVHYNRLHRRVTLIADKIALRPIYYSITPHFAVFATALRILEELREVPKEIDLRGVTEIACFGFPLAERTAYLGISTLMAGEVVHVSDRTVEKHEYWRWDRLPPPEADTSEVSRHAYRRFICGVKRRLATERTQVAFLSGGLDSRSIVAALRSLDVNVHTINFAPAGTQDEAFAKEVSTVFGTAHHQLSKDVNTIFDTREVYNQTLVRGWIDANVPPAPSSERRFLVWSGDGGSVGLGHVYLNTDMVALAQGGETEAAIAAFFAHNTLGIPERLFRRSAASTIASIPTRGMRDELARFACQDQGRALHLFLMFNDQRRHLSDFYENIDLGRLEFQLPFLDSDFLELVLSSPVSDFLGHRFYMEWLKQFSPLVTSVPWQAYPGHVPCRLPIPTDLRYQWAQYYDEAMTRRLRHIVLKQASRLLGSAGCPDRIIDKGRLRVAAWLTRLGVRNYDYAIKTAAVYSRYWSISEASSRQRDC